MGLFSFIKNAGIKVFGIGHMHALEVAEIAAIGISLEEIAATRIEKVIKDLQLQVEKFNLIIEEDLVIVSGVSHDQATKEKVILLVGNSMGITTVDDRMTVENQGEKSRFYTVVKGDSLGIIAKNIYNDPKKYIHVFQANEPMLTHPDKIYVGQVLRIPALD